MKTIEQIYLSLRKNKLANLFIIGTRWLIGFAFIPSGLTKALGRRFTNLDTSNPVGYFFEAMYQTGGYWVFLGISQLIASLLLMSHRFSTLGALIYMAIISNIAIITIAVGFRGTWVITSLMWLATLLLVLWDWNKIKYLFAKDDFVPTENLVPKVVKNRLWSIAGLIIYFGTLIFFLVCDLLQELDVFAVSIYLIVMIATVIFSLIKEFR